MSAEPEFDDVLLGELVDFLDRVEALSEAEERVQVTLNLPKEWLVIAAWMSHKRDMLNAGGQLRPVREVISADALLPADFARATGAIMDALRKQFTADFNEVAGGSERFLKQPALPANVVPIRRGVPVRFAEDLPF